MIKYKEIYCEYFGYAEGDWIGCEVCHNTAIDIHHVKYKSRGGKDEIQNLMALCRACPNSAHSEEFSWIYLATIHETRLNAHRDKTN